MAVTPDLVANAAPERRRALSSKGLRRQRLLTLLEEVWTQQFGLIVAPAGSGKTTLLTQFVASAGVPTIWYRADESDADPSSLLSHLHASAASTFGIDPGASWDSPEVAARDLSAIPTKQILIVIDDLHSIRQTPSEQLLDKMLELVPSSVSVIMASRKPPEIDFSLLRVSGNLLELSADDLRFRSWEVESLFRDIYLEPLPPQELAELARRTEGWAAGLQLFHLATQGKPPQARKQTLAALSGRSKLVREYLARNVLQELPVNLRDFLINTSVLGVLNPSLCNELSSRSDSAAILSELEERQVFTYAIDESENYRYHEVMRSYLEAALHEEVGEGEFRARFKRAATLLEHADWPAEALRAYSRAEDWESVARLLGRRGEELSQDRGVWIDHLPASIVEQDPWVQLAVARRLLGSGRWKESLAAYTRAEQGFGSSAEQATCSRERQTLSAWLDSSMPDPKGWLGLIRASMRSDPLTVASNTSSSEDPYNLLVSGISALVAGHAESAKQVAARIASNPSASPTLVAIAEATGGLAGLLGGNAGATREIERAAEAFEAIGVPWAARLARAALEMGSTRGSVGEAEAIFELSRESGDPWGTSISGLLLGLGAVARQEKPPIQALEISANGFTALGAGVLGAWARAVLAVGLARSADPRAKEAASKAESLARVTGAVGVQAFVYQAFATIDPQREQDCRLLEKSLRQEFGLQLGREGASSPSGRLFIGRRRELSHLRSILDSARSGSGGAIAIVGEAGIGKTSLGEELASLGRAKGAEVLWGRCAESAPAFWPWVQVIRSYTQGKSDAELEERLGPDETDIVAVLSHIAEQFESSAGGAKQKPEPLQFRFFDVLTRFLRRLAHVKPVIILLDDLHWIDASSMQILQFLATELVDERLLISVMCRNSFPHRPITETLLSDFHRVHLLRLSGLDEEELSRLMQSVMGTAPPSTLVRSIHAATGGNPFFALETTRMLLLEGSTDDESLPNKIVLPQSVREVIVRRVDLLSAETRQLLGIASVIGESFDASLLGEIASVPDPRGLLDEAGQAGVIVRRDDRTFEFAHEVIWDTLYSVLAPELRAELHGRIADILEDDRSGGSRATVIANHYLQSENLRVEKAIEWSLRAARQELASTAYEESAAYCEAALEICRRDDSKWRSELLYLLGESWRRIGNRALASDSLHLAVDAARIGGDSHALARAVISLSSIWGDTGSADTTLIKLLEEALKLIPKEDSIQRAELMAQLSAALYPVIGEEDRRIDLAGEAHAMAERLRDPHCLATVLCAWHWAIWGPDRIEEKARIAREARELAEESGDPELALRSLRFRMHDLMEMGDLRSFDAELAEHGRLASELREPTAKWHHEVYRTMRALLEGRFAEVEMVATSALHLGQEAGDTVAPQYYALQIGILRAEQGRLDEIEAGVRAFVEQYPGVPAWQAAKGFISSRLGRSSEARAILASLVPESGPDLPRDWHWLTATCILADICCDLGDRKRALTLYQVLEPWRGKISVAGVASVFFGPVNRYLGSLAITLQQYDRAVLHLEDALEEATRMGARPEIARIQLSLAEALLARDPSGAETVAGEFLRQSMETASELGMLDLLNRAKTLTHARPATGKVDGPEVEIRCFGGLSLSVGGRKIELSEVKPRARSLLRILALHGTAVHREILIEALWPEIESEAGTRNLQVAISSLRKLLGPEGHARAPSLTREGDAYLLRLPPGSYSDVRAFDEAMSLGRTALAGKDHETAIAAFNSALGAYAGDLFPAEGPAEWVISQRERYRGEAIEAAQSLAELFMENGQPVMAASICERGLRIDRYRDSLWRLLEKAHRLAGDHAAAERVRRDYLMVLDELGIAAGG